MYNIENIQTAVKAYHEEVKSLSAIRAEFDQEVSRFCGIVLDFMGMAKLKDAHFGPAYFSGGKITWENGAANRAALDKAYDAFDNYVVRSIDHIRVLKKQYMVE